MSELEPYGQSAAAEGPPRRAPSPWLAHGLAVALLFAVLSLRYGHLLTFPDILNDEISYTRAARLVAAGKSPYYGGYLYPPLVAVGVAAAQERWGLLPVLVGLRAANFLGVAATAWIALLPLPWGRARRWAVGTLYLTIAPAVHFTLLFSNLSAAVVGMISIALLVWPSAPLAAGLLLGGSLAIKPLAPGALAVLLAHRPSGRGRRHLATAAVAAAAAALLILPFPYLREMLSVPASSARQLIRTVSPHRLAYLLGWHDNAVPLSLALLAAAVWVTRRKRRRPETVTLLGAVTSIAATPVVWSHSLLLTLPLQVLALQRVSERWREARGSSQARRLVYEAAFVGLGVAAIQFAQGAHGIYDRSLALQLAGAALPALAPIALLAYVLATGGTRGSAAGNAGPGAGGPAGGLR